MSRAKPPLPIVPLHQLPPGQLAECFALLIERTAATTRDGKPYFAVKFRDKVRTVDARIWADHLLFAECEAGWKEGQFYRIRGVYSEHERYGPQIEIHQLRPVSDSDAADGFREADFIECSRFDSEAMLTELRTLVEAEIVDVPLRRLTLLLLERHAAVIRVLPAHPRAFFPFPGGWLEHTLSVTCSVLLLADRYRAHYPELSPPLNRDLVIAGSVLHEIGRVAELVPGEPGKAPTPTIPGHLFGPSFLARDLIRDAARDVSDLNQELLMLLEHVIVTHLTKPEWGSPRLPAIPEVLILHHADDLDAKLEMYIRCLSRDTAEGPFTEYDPVLKKPLLKQRSV